jgi:hypothetical protein
MPDEESAVAYLFDVANSRAGADLVEVYLHRVDGCVELLAGPGRRSMMPVVELRPAM